MLETTASHISGSQSTLAMSASSMSSQPGGRRHSRFPKSRSRRAMSGASSVFDNTAISQVADAQGPGEDQPGVYRHRGSLKKSKRGSKGKLDPKHESVIDALTPIREFAEDDLDPQFLSPDLKDSKLSTDLVKSYATLVPPNKKKPKEV